MKHDATPFLHIDALRRFAMVQAMEHTPETIRRRAFDARVSLNKVLLKAGIAPSTFYRWERGGVTPQPITLAKVDDALTELEGR